MTREEVAEVNKILDYAEKVNSVAYKALKKALEREPCDDCVSRQAVLDVIERERFKGDAISEIEKLPFVTSQPCGDCISRQAVEDAIAETIVNGESLGYAVAYDILSDLPSVTPQQKMGQWISYNWNDNGIARWGIKCDQCYKEYRYGGEMGGTYNYCPNCGSYNGGVKKCQ